MHAPCPRAAAPVAIFGVPLDNVTLPEALERVTAMIEARRPHYVVTANVDFLVQARRDAELRQALVHADLVTCDGMPLVWASRLLRNPLPERVTGADLVPQLLEIAAAHGYRVFFLGATPDANRRAVANVQARFPRIRIAGHYSPPFRPLAEMDNDEIIQRIRAAQPDILLVAFGCPKAEKWMARHYRALGVPVSIGVGATIDFLAGAVRRAPRWMQESGCEWMFRLVQEPRRLFRRYFSDLLGFTSGLASQLRRVGLSRHQGSSRHCLVHPSGDWLRIQLPEQLDRSAVQFGNWIWRRAVQFHCLLDLRGTRGVDSTGLALLLRLRRDLRFAGKEMVLLSSHPAIRRLLEYAGLEKHVRELSDAGKTTEPQPRSTPDSAGASAANTATEGAA